MGEEKKSHKGSESEPEHRLQSSSPESESESSAGKTLLLKTVDAVTSLISLSYTIKVFAVKWQLIRVKLDELLSGLTALEDCDSGENSPLSGTIQAVSETLAGCFDLARRCAESSYSGKLLMQSDLDRITAKLSAQIDNLSEIYTSGSLIHSHAIVVSKPGPSSSREDMKFYLQDLSSRLRIGGTEMKKQALISLNHAIVDDERYVKIALEIGDFLGILVSALDSLEIEIQEQSSMAISVIAGFEDYRGVLIGAGIIAQLVRVLENGSRLGRESSARALQKLTENSENSWSVSAHGGVTALLKICKNCNNGGELIGLACGVLRNLLGVEEIKRFMVEEGAIAVFIKLVRSKDEISQISSIEFLQNLASIDEPTKKLVLQEDSIWALVTVLDPESSSSSKPREIALRAIMILCFPSRNALNMLMNLGFIDHIHHFLRNGESSIQELALKAVLGLCRASEEAAKIAMGDSGIMTELVKLLNAKSYQVKEMAAEALSSMVSVPRNRKIFAQDDRNIGLLLQSLDPEEEGNSGKRKFLLAALMSLTSSSSGRKKMINCVYVKNIEKLAEDEVCDAQKIVRKLSSNRLHRFLSGIWHS